MNELRTQDRLKITAADLFRSRGYHGVGLNEILSKAGAPKGSLYHHFPNGKSDLALAAAEWAADGLSATIDDAFEAAGSYREGATTLCYKLAKLFDISGDWDGCPVSSILLDGPDNDAFRDYVNFTYDRWINQVAGHAERLGQPADQAHVNAEILMIGIQGAWVLARARRSSGVLRQLPGRIAPRH